MSEERIRILVVEDEEIDRLSIERLVKTEQLPYDLSFADTVAGAVSHIEHHGTDLVIIDYSLPDGSGLEVQKSAGDTPCIFITGAAERSTVVEAMKASAYDFIIKDVQLSYINLLPAAIQATLSSWRAKAQVELQERIINSMTEMVLLVDEQGSLISANSAVERTLGYTPREMPELGCCGALNAGAAQCATGPPIKTRHGSYQIELTRQDGTTIWTEWTESPGPNGLMICTGRNITERKRAEKALLRAHEELERRVEERTAELLEANVQLKQEIEERKHAQDALRESEEKYRKLMETANDAIFIADSATGVIIDANRKAAKLLGRPLEEIIGMHQSRLHPQEDFERYVNTFYEHMQRQGVVSEDIYVVRADGSRIPVEISAGTMEVGGRRFAQGIFRDISQRKRTEKEKSRLRDQLLKAQKMEAVGTLAGGIAHDFNNLLQAIHGYAELLLLDMKEHDRGYEDLKEITRAGLRGRELVRQLLTFSRKVESKLRPIRLNHEVEQLGKLLARTIPKMIDIELHLAGDLRVINADPVQLEQVLMNLAVNAADAMPEGGKLYISTENITLDEEFCRSLLEVRPGHHVLLSVADTGSGMDQEVLEHIFEPFYSTKDVGKGTGLGLSMVYGIIRAHRGHITCFSEPGIGTTFNIYLPAMESLSKHLPGEDAAPLTGGTGSILLVDDEEFIRSLGERTLRRFGYEVLTADGGESALEIYRARGDEIDLVVLDLIMPGMGGGKCLEELLRIDPRVKIVIASGYSSDGPQRAALEAEVKGFISKPYEIRQMLEVIQKVLEGG